MNRFVKCLLAVLAAFPVIALSAAGAQTPAAPAPPGSVPAASAAPSAEAAKAAPPPTRTIAPTAAPAAPSAKAARPIADPFTGLGALRGAAPEVAPPPAAPSTLAGADPAVRDLLAPPGAVPALAAAPVPVAPLSARLDPSQTADVIRISLILTLLALLPAIAICMTPFVRIVVVLSMIRHAFGMPETPPSQVLVTLALFLTIFVMMPTLTAVNAEALQPFMNGAISVQEALDKGSDPMRTFMLRQVHDEDIKTVYDIAKKPLPSRAANVGLMELTTAFMLNELRVAFKMGFVILLPFLLIDLVVSSILLGLGMMMVPPSTLSLPIKVLMFVLIDGWSLVLQGVTGSFR